MVKLLDGQVAIITGASRGIGRSVALRLAEMGCNVVVNYVRNEEMADALLKELQAFGVEAIKVKADVRYPENLKIVFNETKQYFGRLDIFISNAAKGVFGPVQRIGANGFDLAMATGPKALLIGAQEAATLFGEKGGKIVALSSIGSLRCLPAYAAVGTAKAGLEAMVKYLAVELGPKNINVNAVSGGPIDTEALEDFGDPDTLKKSWAEKTPLRRIGTVEDIAGIVAFLCTKDAQWIQGQSIVADGGLTLTM